MRRPTVDIKQLKKIKRQTRKATAAWTVLGIVSVALLLTLAIGNNQDYSEYNDVDYDE
jgi:uncharacterized membrane protein